MKTSLRARSVAVLAPIFVFAACGPETDFSEYDEPIDFGEETSGIINGTAVPADNSGMVRLIHDSTMCSGTLLTNDWVLTANHCDNAVGDTVTMGAQSRTVKRVLPHPDISFGVDVALVQLTSPMTMNNSNSGFRRQVESSLLTVGTQVTCFGYGNNTFHTGAGSTLRSAVLNIQNGANNLYVFIPNATGQIMWRGDSGGTCLTAAGRAITVHKSSTFSGTQVLSSEGVTSQYFAPWVNGVIDGSWQYEPITEQIQAPTAGSDLTAYVQGGIPHAVYRDANNGHVIELWKINGVWSSASLTAQHGGTASAGTPFGFEEGGRQRIVYRSADGHIREYKWQSPMGWSVSDLSAITGATNASSDPVAYVHQGRVNVIYRGTGNHIHALVLNAGSWTHQNLTSGLGATAAASKPTVYVHNGVEQKVVYRGSNNHIIELWNTGTGWNWSDLTNASGGPNAQGDPSGYSFGNQQHIIYRASNNHVIELWGGWNGWTAHDVTNTTGAPNAAGSPMGYISTSLGKQCIVYRTGTASEGDIVHLTGSNVGNFQIENLTTESGAFRSPAPTGTPGATVESSAGSQHVFYRDTAGRVFELRTPRT